jgi:hypothetical protein
VQWQWQWLALGCCVNFQFLDVAAVLAVLLLKVLLADFVSL